MARQPKTDYVLKRCRCVKWKECTHPWHIQYREGKELGPDGVVRARGLRQALAPLVGREPIDFRDAKAEARRAIQAWADGRNAADLLPGDAPTLEDLVRSYRQRPDASAAEKYQVRPIVNAIVHGRRFGDVRAAAVTREMLEAFRKQRPPVAANRNLALLRAMFNWAVLSELVPATPFKIGDVTAVSLKHEEPRTRRLEPGEEQRLLAETHGLLRDLAIAALETGCRIGELLSLQWDQVRGDLFLPAGKTKAKKPRRVPVSRVLRAVLDARRLDPAGHPLPALAYVFGDAVGRQRRSFLKTAWENAVLRSRQVTPARTKTGALTPACREQLRDINLHVHDLRREAGSRWMDAGVPLATIQRWLGHHNISQTSTYLAASGGGDTEAMLAYERMRDRVAYGGPLSDTDGSSGAAGDTALSEKTSKSTVVH